MRSVDFARTIPHSEMEGPLFQMMNEAGEIIAGEINCAFGRKSGMFPVMICEIAAEDRGSEGSGTTCVMTRNIFLQSKFEVADTRFVFGFDSSAPGWGIGVVGKKSWSFLRKMTALTWPVFDDGNFFNRAAHGGGGGGDIRALGMSVGDAGEGGAKIDADDKIRAGFEAMRGIRRLWRRGDVPWWWIKLILCHFEIGCGSRKNLE